MNQQNNSRINNRYCDVGVKLENTKIFNQFIPYVLENEEPIDESLFDESRLNSIYPQQTIEMLQTIKTIIDNYITDKKIQIVVSEYNCHVFDNTVSIESNSIKDACFSVI